MPPRKRKAVQARLDDTEESAVEAHPNHSEETVVQARPNHTEDAAVQARLDHTEKSAVHPAYDDLLPEAARTFLFSDTFSNALAGASRECSHIFNVTEGAALDEFRRLIAIKFWVADVDATKISPSHVSKSCCDGDSLTWCMLTGNSGSHLARCYLGHEVLRQASDILGRQTAPQSCRSRRVRRRESRQALGEYEG